MLLSVDIGDVIVQMLILLIFGVVTMSIAVTTI